MMQSSCNRSSATCAQLTGNILQKRVDPDEQTACAEPPTPQPHSVSVIQSQARVPPAAPRLSDPQQHQQQRQQQAPQPVLAPRSAAAGGTATPGGRMKKPSADKDSDEYRQRRERNNLAVKKSRMRSKQKAQDTQQRVNELKEENERLEAKIKLLSKELSVLKDLFLEHAHNLADTVQPASAGARHRQPRHRHQQPRPVKRRHVAFGSVFLLWREGGGSRAANIAVLFYPVLERQTLNCLVNI
ncbi:unnamed protein product [Merluccius merluccius]